VGCAEGSQAKPKPSDKAVVILFVVGGVAAHELQEVAAALKEAGLADGDGPQVMVGGTALLAPTDVNAALLHP
jgi:hypothetical protein